MRQERVRQLKWLAVMCGATLAVSCGGGGGSVGEPQAASPPPAPAPGPAPSPAPPPPTAGTSGPFVDVSKIPAAQAGFGTMRITASADKPGQNEHTGQFRTVCTFSHMNFDDPIVAPGRPGASHLHTFFGNTGITSESTQQSIETTGNSTCPGGIANRTGYWVPALIDTLDGRPIAPLSILVYYKSDPLPGVRVQPIPRGLRMVAGNADASSPPDRIDWGCLSDTTETRGKSIPAVCAAGNTLEMTVEFPPCWDGVNLDAPDHKSHMAYPVGEPGSPTGMGCPASHPVQLPNIVEKVRYRVTANGATARWRLSSDRYATTLPGGYSAHADWFNGWDDATQRKWITRCLQANRDCHGDLLGDGTTLY